MAETAVKQIKIPPGISPAMRKLMNEMRDFARVAQAANDNARPLRIEDFHTHVGTSHLKMRTLSRRFSELGQRMAASYERMKMSLGPMARVFVSGMEATLRVVAGTITTVVMVATAMAWVARRAWEQMVDLADKMTQDHFTALSTQATVGGVRAFRRTFAGVPGDPMNILQNIMTAQTDLSSDAYIGLAMLGVRAGRGKSSADIAVAAAVAARAYVRSLPVSQWMPMAEASKLTKIFNIDTLTALRKMSDAEFQQLIENYAKAKQEVEVSQKTEERLVRLHQNLELARLKIVTVFEEKLGDPEFTRRVETLSNDFVKLIQDISKLQGTKDFFKSIEGFLRWMDEEITSGDAITQIQYVIMVAKDWWGVAQSWAEWLNRANDNVIWLGEKIHKLVEYYFPSKAPEIIGLQGEQYFEAPGLEKMMTAPALPFFAPGGGGRVATGGGEGFTTAGLPTDRVPETLINTTEAEQAKYQDRKRKLQNVYPQFSNSECVELTRKIAGVQEGVKDWRRGENVFSTRLPIGTPVATFLSRSGQPSLYYDAHQGVGAPGNNTTHTGILMGYTKKGILLLEQYNGAKPHIHEYIMGDPRGGEKDARQYFVVDDPSGLPAGTDDPYRAIKQANPEASNVVKLNVPSTSTKAETSAIAKPLGGDTPSNDNGLKNELSPGNVNMKNKADTDVDWEQQAAHNGYM
jgi:hypothetical protein